MAGSKSSEKSICHPTSILITREVQFALDTLYLGLLYAQVNEYADNVA